MKVKAVEESPKDVVKKISTHSKTKKKAKISSSANKNVSTKEDSSKVSLTNTEVLESPKDKVKKQSTKRKAEMNAEISSSTNKKVTTKEDSAMIASANTVILDKTVNEGPEYTAKTRTKKQKVQKNTEMSTLTNKKESTKDDPPKVLPNETEISEATLKKINKKKAKKLAQKLKKAQRKLAANTEKQSVETKEGKKIKKAQLSTDTATEQKSQETISPTEGKDTIIPVAERVLKKKERKIKKRQLLKDKKLAENNTRDPAVEEATVFVGNLPVNTKRAQLVRLFQPYGPVQAIRLRSAGGKILHKHKMRKLAGSLNAYVVLSNKSSAENSLKLNGTEFKGNHLRVTKSTKNSIADMSDETKRTVFVGNLKYSATEESLREIFTSCGEVEYVRCLRDGDKGCKGVAYVCFKSPDSVGLALELNETILDDRPIHVECFNPKKLGAKEQRDAEIAKIKKTKQKNGNRHQEKGKNSKDKLKSRPNDDPKKTKKSEFRGVKVEAMKKKLKMKKKKSKSQALDLIKKIAPKVLNGK